MTKNNKQEVSTWYFVYRILHPAILMSKIDEIILWIIKCWKGSHKMTKIMEKKRQYFNLQQKKKT